MESIEVATLLPGAKKFHESNINQTWKGHVKTNTDTVVVFAKLIPPREICIEAYCALLGQALGIPIPKPFLILADSSSLDVLSPGHHALMFGSEDAAYPSFRRYAQCKEAMEKLEAFKSSLDVGVFDEWIANHDRNLGNMLYDGGEDFFFIDHGLAIPNDLLPTMPASDNNILRVLYSLKTEIEKFRVLRAASQNITPVCHSLNLLSIMDSTLAEKYIPSAEINGILSFLSRRLPVLESLIRSRIGIKQTDMFL
ncbi:HipA family kinase [Serratia sp. JSRIV004]|uniref:HipA family kinase n=1 Tax=Serratia sp. JSRIV004 TaxID=2831895 RepID=UPI001CBAC5B4|nr:HipA family kinase [Serratia sp. JSRIV004]UAN57421.1 hypothetical protein KGP21_28205 [Serratia sp. JSRIV004]